MIVELVVVGTGAVATLVALFLQSGLGGQNSGEDVTRDTRGPDTWLCYKQCVPCLHDRHDECDNFHCLCREGDYCGA